MQDFYIRVENEQALIDALPQFRGSYTDENGEEIGYWVTDSHAHSLHIIGQTDNGFLANLRILDPQAVPDNIGDITLSPESPSYVWLGG